MDLETFRSGHQRLMVAFNGALEAGRFAVAEQYINQLWELFNQQAAVLELESINFKLFQVEQNAKLVKQLEERRKTFGT